MGHWMWYIVPQIIGLGYSEATKYYSIKNLEEAVAYLKHEVLGSRLLEISNTLLTRTTDNAASIMGRPDDLKLHSCMTLFAIADEENLDNVFEKVLLKYFKGKYDRGTLDILDQ
jgi:uncharacterized protein (DUF1810 family)